MTWPMAVMLAVVIASVPAAWWNVSAAALVASWALAQAYWLVTGDNLPIQVYVICDIAVLGVIFCKPPTCDSGPYHGVWEQATAFLYEKNISDRIVISIFPLAWIFYIAPVDDTSRWWVLWFLVIVQFVSVTTETTYRVIRWLREHHEHKLPPPWAYRMARRAMGVG